MTGIVHLGHRRRNGCERPRTRLLDPFRGYANAIDEQIVDAVAVLNAVRRRRRPGGAGGRALGHPGPSIHTSSTATDRGAASPGAARTTSPARSRTADRGGGPQEPGVAARRVVALSTVPSDGPTGVTLGSARSTRYSRVRASRSTATSTAVASRHHSASEISPGTSTASSCCAPPPRGSRPAARHDPGARAARAAAGLRPPARSPARADPCAGRPTGHRRSTRRRCERRAGRMAGVAGLAVRDRDERAVLRQPGTPASAACA